MRRISRTTLSRGSTAALARLQARVDAAPSPAVKAGVLWKQKENTKPRKLALAEVRKALGAMASGRKRCMYCEDSLGTDIDHFRPKALYPAKTFAWENHLLACSHCNSNEKRTQFPLDAAGNALLLDPTVDDPFAHLALVPETGYVSPVSPEGTETEKVFGLNRREELTTGRSDAWQAFERIVADVGSAGANAAVVAQLVDQARRLSFQSVVHHFVRDGLSASPAFVKQEHAAVLKQTRALWQWAL